MSKIRNMHNRKMFALKTGKPRKVQPATSRISVLPGCEETYPHRTKTLWKLVRTVPPTPTIPTKRCTGDDESWVDEDEGSTNEEQTWMNEEDDWMDEEESWKDEDENWKEDEDDEDWCPENDSRITMEIHPGTAAFDATVLAPRRITIETFAVLSNAFQHFGTDPPSPALASANGGTATHYQNIPTLRNTPTSTWLDSTNKQALSQTSRTYHLLHHDAFPPAEWQAEALTSLFPPSTPRIPPPPTTPFPLPQRLLGESYLPTWDTPSTWTTPPTLASPSTQRTSSSNAATSMATARPLLAADLTPSISYLLWTGGFGSPAVQLADVVHVRYRHMCCPYLSAEVAAEASDAARLRARQVLAAVGAVALWNRWRLARWRCVAERRLIRHYAVVLAGVLYEVWVLRLRGGEGGEWAGCEMVRVAEGEVDDEEGLGGLMDWVNEIQRWGNTVYAQGCAEDVGVAVARAVEGAQWP